MADQIGRELGGDHGQFVAAHAIEPRVCGHRHDLAPNLADIGVVLDAEAHHFHFSTSTRVPPSGLAVIVSESISRFDPGRP